jgi:hypothetical protein
MQQQQMYSQPQQPSQEQYYYSNSGMMHQDPTMDFNSDPPFSSPTYFDDPWHNGRSQYNKHYHR